MTMSTNDISIEQLTHALAPIINRSLTRGLKIHITFEGDKEPLTLSYSRTNDKHPIDKTYGCEGVVVHGNSSIHDATVTPCITLYHLIAAHADLVK